MSERAEGAEGTAAAADGAAADLALLRRFEPVVCYTHGEQFFPTAVDGYLRRASLWTTVERRPPRRLAAEGALDAAGLVRAVAAAPDGGLYLRFTDQPLDGAAYRRWRHDRAAFRAPGRLTRVGLAARIVDACFDASLLLRGRMPGGATSIAAEKYRAMRAADDRFVYYGRVVRVGGYVVLNYWFFYAMNPWRSGFFGANDHEADWEQLFVYLSAEADGPLRPRWVAYAQHDFAGDDLRRRWDDPQLRRAGEHPLVFAGAGSHASYFEPGEYLMGVEPAALRPLRAAVGLVRQFWVERLGQGGADVPDAASGAAEQRADRGPDGGAGSAGSAGDVGDVGDVAALFSVPFVDYARGDGLRIGPGEANAWSPRLLDGEPGWVEGFRGLWGLDTRDPFGGERAPSGPKYNRDGTVRVSWYDPLGWAGLDKVSPPGAGARELEAALRGLESDRAALGARIEAQRTVLRRLALEPARSGRAGEPGAAAQRAAEQGLRDLVREASDLDERLAAGRVRLARLSAGDPGDPQAHLRHIHRPEPAVPERARLVELWSALSAGVLIAALGALIVLAPAGWPLAIVAVFGGVVVVEAAAQRRLIRVLLNVTIVLAIATALVLVKDYWQAVIVFALLAFLVSLVVQNLDELRRT